MEYVERMKREGSSELLMHFARIVKYQPMCEDVMKKATETHLSLFNRDDVYWYHKGIAVVSSVLVEMDKERVVEVNAQSRRLLRVNGEEVSGIEHNRVLDLNDDGERWEGDVLNNKPYGWGVVYDSENRMVYEGFRIGSVSVCYGRSYYPDVGVIEYEGMICKGKRWGRGVQYDKQGVVMRDGEWVNDESVEMTMTMTEENQRLFTCVEELIVSDGCGNGMEWRAFDVTCIVHLRKLRVGIGCFGKTEELKLIGLNELERVVIGHHSFTKSPYSARENGMNPNRHFYLKDCPKVKELKIGCKSFMDYSVCEIENVNQLEVIEIGDLNEGSGNFFYASLELKSNVSMLRMMNRFTQFEITSLW